MKNPPASTKSTSQSRLIKNPFQPFMLMEDEMGKLTTSWPGENLQKQFSQTSEVSGQLEKLAKKLEAYFRGEDIDFSDVPLPAGSEFQRACWEACREIPRGETISYARLAELAGSDRSACRAAGQAMRHNPLPVIVPCHRVVSASGRLHGFAGSQDPDGANLAMKRTLLNLEGAFVASDGRTLFDDPSSSNREIVNSRI